MNFDGITYAKGASSLKQLVAWVGEEEFLTGLRAYFKAHAFGNSELSDLLGALEEASGRDLHSWAKEWLQTSGVNTLTPEFEVDDEGRFTSFAVRQTAHPDFPTLRRHRIGIGLYDAPGRPPRAAYVDRDRRRGRAHRDRRAGRARRSRTCVLLNDGDLTYAKIRLDERSLATVVDAIATLDDSLARALCWGAAWDMTRDAEMSATDFVTLVLRGIGSETDLMAVSRLPLRPAGRRHLLRPGEPRGARGPVGAGAARRCSTAPSRAATTSWRSRAPTPRAARSDQALDRLDGTARRHRAPSRAWPSTPTCAGRCLTRAGRSRAGPTRPGSARSWSATTRSRARSGRPPRGPPGRRAEAKDGAWNDAVVRDDVPNETQRSIALAFRCPGRTSCSQPYLARYLEAASTDVGGEGHPAGVDRAGVHVPARARQRRRPWTRSTRGWRPRTANPAAKRYVREGRADIARALAAQAQGRLRPRRPA